MAYATINKPTEHFNTKLYAGTNSPQSITGVGFQPDWTWIKVRNIADNHYIYDSVRGATKFLNSDLTNAEGTLANGLTSFNSDGFSLGDSGSTNNSSNTFVAWNWKAGGTASSNTDGTITTQVSANTTSGVSIATYTGNGSNGATVGHGLGATPDVVILRRRNGTEAWPVWTSSLAGNTSYLRLNAGDAVNTATDLFNSTTPNSSVVTLGTGGFSNTNTWTYVMYCFKSIAGFSKFGSYTGNGSTDGPFIYTGFKPAWLLVKKTDSATSWKLLDNKRDTSNDGTGANLNADSSDAEDNNSAYAVDFLSNGFKIRNTNGNFNNSGANHIYMAFAEAPIVGTNNIPATAR